VVCNLPLSEYGVLGFDLGYSMETPYQLVLWEAQFGDFANGGQVIIDQFIASGEVKWGRQCGLVLQLPHGYDGQGPEHSSARIERFLQLCDDREDAIHDKNWDVKNRSVIQRHNLQVVNCTTPANMFHVLRRQVHRGFRKPLIIITPKRMLKLRASYVKLSDLTDNNNFIRYIPDVGHSQQAAPEEIKRLIVCSGQIYYDLAAYKEKNEQFNVAVSRVEQLSPFPFDSFIDDVKLYPNLESVVWAQEEPMNGGAWSYCSNRMASSLRFLGEPNGISRPIYVGRDVLAAPSVGDVKLHQDELDTLLHDAFDLTRTTNSYYEKYMKE